MIIMEKPYASEFLVDTVAQNDWWVLDNKTVRDSKIEDEAFNLVSSERAKNYFISQEFPLIYSNSENAITWVLDNLPNSNLSNYIRFFKDKIAFRKMLSNIYPNFYFKEVDYNDLKNIDSSEIPFPVVIKPSVGFLSLGVHTVQDAKDWNNIIGKIDKEMEKAKALYPEHVVNSSKFIIEQFIKGEEYAIDAYYDRNGEPVFLNIFHHPFLDEKDVRDRIYLTSVSIMIKYMALFGQLLREIGNMGNIRNFPMHIELRVTDDGEVIPIEVNPMRFAGWCTTDVAKYAWGINVYECFHEQIKPDWNEILSKASKEVFYFSMAETSEGFDRNNYQGFDYEKFLSNFSNVIEVRKINPVENPLFAIIFGSTLNKDEVLRILSLKTQEYVM